MCPEFTVLLVSSRMHFCFLVVKYFKYVFKSFIINFKTPLRNLKLYSSGDVIVVLLGGDAVWTCREIPESL
jgi:hypothetical protein